MRPGDIALTPATSHIGRLIGSVTRSRYSHVRLIVDADGSTVEAQPDGAARGRVQPGDVIVAAPLTDEERALLPDVAAELVGTPYSFADFFAVGLAELGLALPSLRRRIERPDRLICSQLVDLAWSRVGFEAFRDGRLPQAVSPGDLADLAFRSGWSAHELT